jgi:hypothetical protein
MSRPRALIWGALGALIGLVHGHGSGHALPVPPSPSQGKSDLLPKPTRHIGNNRKRTKSARAKRRKWAMETASRARNLGRRGQRRKGNR